MRLAVAVAYASQQAPSAYIYILYIYIYGCISLRAVRSANGNIYNNIHIYIYIYDTYLYIGDIQLSIIYIYGETHPCLAGGFSSQIDSRGTSPFVIKIV